LGVLNNSAVIYETTKLLRSEKETCNPKEYAKAMKKRPISEVNANDVKTLILFLSSGDQ